MKRTPRLTKRERKAASPRPAGSPSHSHDHGHIHCITCGKHLNETDFDAPATAAVLTCQHGSQFPSCVGCSLTSQRLLDDHDRTGQPVKAAAAVH